MIGETRVRPEDEQPSDENRSLWQTEDHAPPLEQIARLRETLGTKRAAL